MNNFDFDPKRLSGFDPEKPTLTESKIRRLIRGKVGSDLVPALDKPEEIEDNQKMIERFDNERLAVLKSPKHGADETARQNGVGELLEAMYQKVESLQLFDKYHIKKMESLVAFRISVNGINRQLDVLRLLINDSSADKGIKYELIDGPLKLYSGNRLTKKILKSFPGLKDTKYNAKGKVIGRWGFLKNEVQVDELLGIFAAMKAAKNKK